MSFDHVAGFFGSDAEFRALVAPFVEGALSAGEPVIVGYDERKSDLIRSWLGEDGIDFVSDTGLYATPSRAIAAYSELFTRLTAAGAGRVWISGELPEVTPGHGFGGWDRYESAINAIWDAYPVRSLCLYDATTVSPVVRDVVERSHPRLQEPDGAQVRSERYERPELFTALVPVPDPLEVTAPRLELVDAMPMEARHAVVAAARDVLDDDALADLVLAVSEAVTNARLHGEPPRTLRVWTAPERVVVHVQDAGNGPLDRFAGLLPPPSAATPGGRGVWLMHQLPLAVDLMHAPDCFTVRLRAGRGTPAAD